MDFGLAQLRTAPRSKSTQGARGTLDYMAMETYDAGRPAPTSTRWGWLPGLLAGAPARARP